MKQKADDCLHLSFVPRLDKMVVTGSASIPPDPKTGQVSHGLLWSAPQCQHVCVAAPVGVFTCAQCSSTTPGTLQTKSLFISSQSWHEAYLYLGYTHWEAISCIPPHLVNMGPGPKWTPRTSSQPKGWDQVGAKSTWLTNASKSGFRTLRHLVQGEKEVVCSYDPSTGRVKA